MSARYLASVRKLGGRASRNNFHVISPAAVTPEQLAQAKLGYYSAAYAVPPPLILPAAPGAVLTFRPGSAEGVREITTTTGSTVEHRLAGPAAALPAAIDAVLADYDPIGYGTTKVYDKEFPEDGTRVVILRRAASCD